MVPAQTLALVVQALAAKVLMVKALIVVERAVEAIIRRVSQVRV